MGTDGTHNGGTLILGGIGGELRFYTFPSSNPSAEQNFSDADITNRAPQLQITPAGQVRIGSTAPTGVHSDYLLAVAGKAVAQSFYVTNPNTWADFVFAPTYQPMSLAKLETYLQLNKHLPAVPPASEVEAKGYSVTEMDAKLLRSIEELTLHVIALNKRVQKLEVSKERTEQVKRVTVRSRH